MNNNCRLEAIERAICEHLNELKKSDIDSNLYSAVEYALQGGGKRVRPMLMLLSAEMFNLDTDIIMPYAIALECIHTYSLIHDDLPAMDDDDIRRGRLTVHKVYGEAMAILAGDKLENMAYEILFSVIKNKGEIRAAGYLAECAGKMVNGQAREMSLIDADCNTISIDDILNIYNDKTTALIRCAIMVPYYVSSAKVNAKQEGNLLKVAHNIGTIFQLVDDMLDTESGVDDGKLTYVNNFGLQKTQQFVALLEDEINTTLSKLDLNTEDLMQYASELTARRI
ncbi:MAG: polyprenyl synthetase family protein [Bacillota bacterium]